MNSKHLLLLVFAAGAAWLAFRLREASTSPAPVPGEPRATTAAFATAPGALLDERVEPNASIPTQPEPPIASLSRNELTYRLVQEIETAIKNVDDPAREEKLTRLIRELIAHDPTAAGYLAKTWEPGDLRQELVRRVTQAWTAADPTGALAWIRGFEDAYDQKNAVTHACFQIAETDPSTAAKIAGQFALGDYRGSVEELTQMWARKEFASASEWVKAQPPGDFRNRLVARLAFVQAETDPAAGAWMVVEQVPPGLAQEDAVVSIIYQWAQRDFAAASAWVEKFPEGSLRDRSNRELAGVVQINAPRTAGSP